MRQCAHETPSALVPRLDDGLDNARLRLYAQPPVQRNRDFEATALGPYILAWMDWCEVAGLRPKTLDNYERDVSRAARLFPRKTPEEFTPQDLLRVAKSFPEKGRRERVAAISGFFKWCLSQDIIERNPFEKMPQIRKQAQRHIDVFSDAEVDDLLNLSLADGALMGILFETGLRKAEARMLQVRRLVLSEGGGIGLPNERTRPGSGRSWVNSALSENTGELVVIAGKGGKDRTVQFGSRLHGLLQELLFLEPMEPTDYLWYGRPGGGRARRDQPIAPSTFDAWWRRCLNEAQVRYRNPHTTRHTHATRWLLAGGHLETLSLRLGHSSFAITADLYGGIANRLNTRRDLELMESHRS